MTRRKQLPPAPVGVDPATRQWMDAVREQLEVAQGVRGSNLDQSVTFGDIIDIGLASFRSRGRARFNATDLMPSSEAPNRTIPPAPAGVEGIAGIGFNTITFQIPLYGNHGFAEIWRAEGAGALLGAAVRIGTTNSTVYSDFDVVEGTVYVYWVRFISTSSIAGPYHASLGVELTSKYTAATILDSLEETLMDLSGDNIFQIIAENFALWDPGPDYETDPNDKALVIGYSGGQLGIDGVYIKTATIDDAAIANLSAAKLTAGQLTSGTWIKGGDFFGGQLRLGVGTIVRDDETGSPAGYATVIDSDGSIYTDKGSIYGGKASANDTAPGYFIGYENSTPEFHVGNSSKSIHWDGTDLSLNGGLIFNGNIVDGEVLRAVSYFSETVIAPPFINPDYSWASSVVASVTISPLGSPVLINWNAHIFANSMSFRLVRNGVNLTTPGTVNYVICGGATTASYTYLDSSPGQTNITYEIHAVKSGTSGVMELWSRSLYALAARN